MTWTVGSATAFIAVVGFAVQRLLDIVDPFVAALVPCVNGRLKTASALDIKKAIMALLSLVAGCGVAFVGQFDVLSFLYGADDTPRCMGMFATAVVLSAGTEGANTLQKYLGYVKDARALPEVTVLPNALSLAPGATATLMAFVKGTADASVEWIVVEHALGTITKSGEFTATAKGTCHVIARSSTQPTASGATTIAIG